MQKTHTSIPDIQSNAISSVFYDYMENWKVHLLNADTCIYIYIIKYNSVSFYLT